VILHPRTAASFLCIALAMCCGGMAAHGQQSKPFQTSPEIRKPATDGKVWGALMYGSSAGTSAGVAKGDLPGDLQDLQARLGKVFPFSRFELLGQHTQDVFREYESWVVPSKDLFLKVDSKGKAEGGGINLHLQFWQDQQVLVKTDAVLREKSPLFIGGPKWRDGQLIFVLMLTKPES
jgi:hypothetical protein